MSVICKVKGMDQDSIDMEKLAKEAPPLEKMTSSSKEHRLNRSSGGRRLQEHSIVNEMVSLALPFVPKPIVKQFAKRYIAGETVEEMIKTVKELNGRAISATVDILGEFIREPDEASRTASMYKQILDEIETDDLKANISVKLSALGLLIDKDLCYDLMHNLVSYAAVRNNFIRIDMEDSACTDMTIDLYLKLREEFSNVGIVLQAYLRRTHDDAIRIIEAGAGNFRLCKGIYIEPRWIAYQIPELINSNYTEILEEMIKNKAYIGIATHDERLVQSALKLIRKYRLDPGRYEFQMLLGVDPELRDILVASGHHVRVYVPFGKKWHAYCMRRLKENPKMAGYILKNLLNRH